MADRRKLNQLLLAKALSGQEVARPALQNYVDEQAGTEPTFSAADLERLAELLRSLRDRGLGLLVIEHNLRFVRRVADLVTVLEAGRRIATGTLAEVAADEAVRTAYLGRQAL